MRFISFHALGRVSAAAVIAAASLLPAAAQQYVPLPQSIIVFPFDKPDTVDQSVADTVTNGIRNRIPNVAGYEATTYNPKSPLIRRAVAAGELTQTQIAGPFDAASAAEVALAAGVDNALVGSVESATNDGATAKVSISVQLVSSRGGEVQKTAGVTGSATAQTGVAPDAVLRLAADDAAAKAITQVFGTSNAPGAVVSNPANGSTPEVAPPAVTPPAAVQPGVQPPATALPTGSIPVAGKQRHKSNTGLIIGGLAILGLIIAAAGNSSGGGGGGGNNGGGGPPIFPF